MTSNRLSKVTAIDLNKQKTSKAGKPYNVANIVYTQPQDGDPTKSMEINIFHGTLKDNPAMGEFIKTINVGDEIGIVKEKNDAGFWNVTGFTTKAEVPAPKPAYTGGGGGGFKKFNSGPKDTAGIKVGAVMHDAVALAVVQKKELVTVADVTAVAEQLLTAAFLLEDRVRAGDFKGSVTSAVGVKVDNPPTTASVANNALDNKIDNLDVKVTSALPF